MSITQLKKVHFIAIGGSVMHNLAIALYKQGIEVSGSDDKVFDPARSNLQKYDLLPSELGWQEEKITEELDCVILGMHAKENNVELAKAKELGLKVYSFPEFIYENSKSKQRVVIAGSHGKTSITSMIVHVLKHCRRKFDYVSGAALRGYETSVSLSDAPIIIIEGDEYPASIEDRVPKFMKYHHHVCLISGIAWDHVNMFPTLEEYVNQFEMLADATPKAGSIIFCEDDNMASIIGNKEREDVKPVPYKAHPARIENEQTILISGNNEIPIKVFGRHNLQNISGAKAILGKLGIKEGEFYEAIRDFKGAMNRMELIAEKRGSKVYKDYAHSPSKVAATTQAIKTQFISSKLVACLELHTFSSLTKDFLKEYKGMFNAPDIAIIFYNPANFEAKGLEPFGEKDIKAAFDRDDLIIISKTEELKTKLQEIEWKDKNLLMMSSGDFDGLDMSLLTDQILD